MKIPRPYQPVALEKDGLCYNAQVIGRTIRFGANSLPESIIAQGQELLAAPVRLVSVEEDAPGVWETDYETNECRTFLQSADDRAVILCGTLRSHRFVANTALRLEYDGCLSIDLKLAIRGQTVPERWGLVPWEPRQYILNSLWLEIPLRPEAAALYNFYPDCDYHTASGETIRSTPVTHSGAVPDGGMYLPFRPLFWLGNEEAGLGFFAESDEHWQPADTERVIEVVPTPEAVILRVRLLDSHPQSWVGDPAQGIRLFKPLSFRFGLQPTPIRPYPQEPYFHNAMHIDCFVKTPGNYREYLDSENRFDRLVEKGVNTLILHEKWNLSQNSLEPSADSLEMLDYIVAQCHARGIRVLPYFGYEVSSADIHWHDAAADVVSYEDGSMRGGWYRVPAQRAYLVCYNTPWAQRFLNCVEKLMDEHHIDGVYLDGTIIPWGCHNRSHGCGWCDRDGQLHVTYPLNAVRRMFESLYNIVDSRGGIINVHLGSPNFTSLGFTHLCWYGEAMQNDYMDGNIGDMPLAHFRAAYTGRNFGIPAEFIAYEKRPVWTYENAVAMSCIHGLMPRPNDITWPLDVQAKIWKVLGGFPAAKSAWLPYWKNAVCTSSDRVRVSYYRYTELDGSVCLLIFVSNIGAEPLEAVRLSIPENVTSYLDLTDPDAPVSCTDCVDLPRYGYRILFAR